MTSPPRGRATQRQCWRCAPSAAKPLAPFAPAPSTIADQRTSMRSMAAARSASSFAGTADPGPRTSARQRRYAPLRRLGRGTSLLHHVSTAQWNTRPGYRQIEGGECCPHLVTPPGRYSRRAECSPRRSIQSILAPASFTIAPHFAIWLTRNLSKSCGVPRLAMAENFARLACAAGVFMPALMAPLSFSTIAGGVLGRRHYAGPRVDDEIQKAAFHQRGDVGQFWPAVRHAATASARTLPALIKGSSVTNPSMVNWVRPPRRSVINCADPL